MAEISANQVIILNQSVWWCIEDWILHTKGGLEVSMHNIWKRGLLKVKTHTIYVRFGTLNLVILNSCTFFKKHQLRVLNKNPYTKSHFPIWLNSIIWLKLLRGNFFFFTMNLLCTRQCLYALDILSIIFKIIFYRWGKWDIRWLVYPNKHN